MPYGAIWKRYMVIAEGKCMSEYLVLYGAGHRCEELLGILNTLNKYAPVIVDSSTEKIGKKISGFQIHSKDVLADYANCFWCVTITDFDICSFVQKDLISNSGFLKEKCIIYYELMFECFTNSHKTQCLVDQALKIDISLDSIKTNSKIFFGLTDGLVLGGIEERVKQLCMAMIGKGFNDIFIISDSREYSYDVDSILASHIIKRDLIPGKHVNNIIKLVEFISGELPCTVITNLPNEFLIAAYIVKFYYPELISVISIVSGFSKSIFDSYLKLSSRSDYYIGVSRDIKQYLQDAGITNALSMTVPFPCERELLREYSLEDKTPIRIGYAGRMDGFKYSQKRMDLLVDVFKRLYDMGVDFVAELAGEGPAKDKMIEIIRQDGLEEKIHFCGRLPKNQMMSFWKNQDIGINMADYEGRSISIAEMMGGGAIPVVTNTSGVGEDIIDGENGFIIALEDCESAANRIKYLYDNRYIIPIMGSRAHEVIWPKSSMENHLKFWNNLLRLEV